VVNSSTADETLSRIKAAAEGLVLRLRTSSTPSSNGRRAASRCRAARCVQCARTVFGLDDPFDDGVLDVAEPED